MRRHRNTARSAILTAGAVILALALTGCGSQRGQEQDSARQSVSASDVSDVTLTLGDQAKGLQTVAQASGAFKGAKYKVKWAQFEGAAPLFQAMQAGSVDTATAADLPTLQALSGGVDLKLVAASQANGGSTAILTQPGSGIRHVRDLKGKRILVSSARGSIAEYLLAKTLRDAGLDYDDVTVQYVLPTAAQAAFSSGKVDNWAIFGAYKAIAVEGGARQVVDGRNGRTSGLGFISASKAALGDPAKKAALKDALRRIDRAQRWGAAHPAAYAEQFAKTNKVSRSVARTVVSENAKRLVPVDRQVVRRTQGVADLMHDTKSLTTKVDVAPAADTALFQ